MRLRLMVAACALVCVLLVPAGGSAALSPSQLQKNIEKTQSKIGRKKGTERVLSTEIAGYTQRIGRLQGKISTLTARQVRLQADLDRKRAELMRIQTALRRERARMVRLRARLIVARRMLARRMVEIYTSDRPDIVTVVLNSKGFADLLEREEFIRRISDQDRNVIRIVGAAKIDATDSAERLDRLERRQQRIAAVVLERRNAIADVRGELIGTRVGYERTRAGKAAALDKTRAARAHLEEHLDGLESEQAAIQQRLSGLGAGPGAGAMGPIRRGSGSMIWPVNGPVTSPFGPRWGRLHAGIDISAGEGTPIRAADSGRVVLLGWTGGYGNYTCVQHGGSLSTCYAHQSRYGTSMGASVSQGQVIGYVGNTGNSFGAHLHFETRINGTPVNPFNYL